MNQEDIEKHLNDLLEQSERDIDKVFANRLKDLLDLLSKMFREYGENGSISRSKIYAYNRFEKEMELIKELIHEDYQELYKEINQLMKDQYKDNYLMSAYVYEMATQLEMQYRVPSAETIKQAIENPINELKLPKLMQNNRNEIVRRIRVEIAQGIQAGEDYSTMATRIEKAVDFATYKAKRVARTETGRTQSLGRLKSAEHAQQYVELDKRWLSSRDTSVRHSHRVLDGQLAGEDGLFEYQGHKAPAPSLFGVARLDINCRCDTIFLPKGKKPEVIRVRDYNDSDYQKRLAERTEEMMTDEGLTEKQALRKAKRQVFPPSKVEKYQTYENWLKDQPRE